MTGQIAATFINGRGQVWTVTEPSSWTINGEPLFARPPEGTSDEQDERSRP